MLVKTSKMPCVLSKQRMTTYKMCYRKLTFVWTIVFYSLMGPIPRCLRRENHFRYGYPDRLRRGSSFYFLFLSTEKVLILTLKNNQLVLCHITERFLLIYQTTKNVGAVLILLSDKASSKELFVDRNAVDEYPSRITVSI